MTADASQASWYQEVTPEPDSKLEQLAAEHDDAKAALEKATERYKLVKDALKSELVRAAPGKTEIRLNSDYLARPLKLVAKKGAMRLDSDRLKAERPDIHEQYLKQGRPSWTLSVVE